MRKLVSPEHLISICLLTLCVNGCIDDESRHHALVLRAVCLTLFAGVLRTRANQLLLSVSASRQSWRTTMSKSIGDLVSVKIILNEQGTLAGKLADAELVFEADAGPLSGMKLIGFAVWER